MGPAKTELRRRCLRYSAGFAAFRLDGQLRRRCLRNLRKSFPVKEIKPAHVFEIALRKPLTEFIHQPCRQRSQDLLPIFCPSRSGLLMLDDQASYFKVGDNPYGIDGGHSRPSGCLHQFPDVLKQDANCLIIAHGIPGITGAGFLHVKEALSFSVLYHTSVPSLSKLPETPLSQWSPALMQ